MAPLDCVHSVVASSQRPPPPPLLPCGQNGTSGLVLATDEPLSYVLLCTCPRTAMAQLSTWGVGLLEGTGGERTRGARSLGQGCCMVCRSPVHLPLSPPQSRGWLGTGVRKDAPGLDPSFLCPAFTPQQMANRWCL